MSSPDTGVVTPAKTIDDLKKEKDDLTAKLNGIEDKEENKAAREALMQKIAVIDAEIAKLGSGSVPVPVSVPVAAVADTPIIEGGRKKRSSRSRKTHHKKSKYTRRVSKGRKHRRTRRRLA